MSTRSPSFPRAPHRAWRALPTPALFAPCCAVAVLLAACGGGSSDPVEPPQAAATWIEGVAATGAPMAGAVVRVVDSDPATPDPARAQADAAGAFRIDVSGLKPPFALTARGDVQGVPTEMHAVVPEVAAQAVNTANITPLTHAVAALVAPGGDPASLATAAALSMTTPIRLADATALLLNTLRSDPEIAKVLDAGFDPLRTAFRADGSGIDGVLNTLSVTVGTGGTVTLTNLSAAVPDGEAPPAPTTLTPAQTATPTAAPKLAPSAPAGDLPTAAEMKALGAKFEACLALPTAQRVTAAADGTVTAVSPACGFGTADWRSNGRNWVQQVGQFTLNRDAMTGGKLGHGQVVLPIAPIKEADPKAWKHRVCDQNPCAVVRWPFTAASGAVSQTEWVLGKTADGWAFVGNDRPYNVFVEPRMQRMVNANRDGPAAGNTADPYFFQDRFESQLRLIFDPSTGDTAHVRAVRFSGPGLPPGGVVTVRSQRCGSDDRFALINQTGTTRVLNSTSFQFWTGGSTTDFKLDAARLDGSPLALPASNPATGAFVDFAPQPVANQSATIPAFAVYKVEIFRFDVLSDTPDEVIYLRSGTPAENAAAGAAKAWPTLAAADVDAFLKPGGAKSGAVTDVAQTLSWTMPSAGAFVGSAYVFAQNFAQATNAQNESATYGARSRLDFEPARFGDLQASGREFSRTPSSTSLSSFSANSGSNPNPRCASQQGLLPLTANTSDYREIGLSFRGTDRKLYNAVWFWEN